MRSLVIACLVYCAAHLGAVEAQPIEAEVTRADGSVETLWIVSETLSGIKCAQSKNAGFFADLPRSTIRSVDYVGLEKDIDYARGSGALARGDYERAIKTFERAAARPVQALSIAARQRIAEAQLAQGAHTEAVGVLASIIKEYPKWPHMVDVWMQIGDILIAAEDYQRAEATFAKIAVLADDFGPQAVSSSLLGQARVKIAQRDNAGAVPLLAEAYGMLGADDSPTLRGQIGLSLAEQQMRAKQIDAATATLRGIMYLPIAGDDLTKVHETLAGIALDRGDLITAFDHASLGSVAPGAEDEARSSARAMARRVQKRIDQDPQFSDADKLVYRLAVKKL